MSEDKLCLRRKLKYLYKTEDKCKISTGHEPVIPSGQVGQVLWKPAGMDSLVCRECSDGRELGTGPQSCPPTQALQPQLRLSCSPDWLQSDTKEKSQKLAPILWAHECQASSVCSFLVWGLQSLWNWSGLFHIGYTRIMSKMRVWAPSAPTFLNTPSASDWTQVFLHR